MPKAEESLTIKMYFLLKSYIFKCMESKIINIKIESVKYSRMLDYCQTLGFCASFSKKAPTAQGNISKLIKFLAICGYTRWKYKRDDYFNLIRKNKWNLYRNQQHGNIQADAEDDIICSVKFPTSLLDELEIMRQNLETQMKNQSIYKNNKTGPNLINVSQMSIKKNRQKLPMTELLKIIIDIEITELSITWAYFKQGKIKNNQMVIFPMNVYIQLCEKLDACGIKGNNIRYFAMVDLFLKNK